ncbi:uncharacterized protein LOC143817539 [Ranitomeya variabilis]|uniref:uncharacterized protein LOC143817539 n=1 Tax=Ranitomeya variabilis TaxID=490064 RepID=UPI004056DA11
MPGAHLPANPVNICQDHQSGSEGHYPWDTPAKDEVIYPVHTIWQVDHPTPANLHSHLQLVKFSDIKAQGPRNTGSSITLASPDIVPAEHHLPDHQLAFSRAGGQRLGNGRIFVGNLPAIVQEKKLELFHQYGWIRTIELKNHGGGGATPFAFITFQYTREAENAMSGSNGYEFSSRHLRVEFARASRRPGRGYGELHWRNGSLSRRTEYRVFVSELSPSGSLEDLKDHMREAGQVCFADVRKDGPGIVEFVRKDDTEYALRKLDDTKFCIVTYCTSWESRTPSPSSINLVPGVKLPKSRCYNISGPERQAMAMKDYITERGLGFYLPLAEFEINNRCQESTGKSSFFGSYGFQPQFSSFNGNSPSGLPEEERFSSSISTIWQRVTNNLRKMGSKYKGVADRRLMGPDLCVWWFGVVVL